MGRGSGANVVSEVPASTLASLRSLIEFHACGWPHAGSWALVAAVGLEAMCGASGAPHAALHVGFCTVACELQFRPRSGQCAPVRNLVTCGLAWASTDTASQLSAQNDRWEGRGTDCFPQFIAIIHE